MQLKSVAEPPLSWSISHTKTSPVQSFRLIVLIIHLTQSSQSATSPCNSTMSTLRKAKASLLALIFLVDVVSFSGLVAARPIAVDQSDIVSPLRIEQKA
jgi:hypothetical protein